MEQPCSSGRSHLLSTLCSDIAAATELTFLDCLISLVCPGLAARCRPHNSCRCAERPCKARNNSHCDLEPDIHLGIRRWHGVAALACINKRHWGPGTNGHWLQVRIWDVDKMRDVSVIRGPTDGAQCRVEISQMSGDGALGSDDWRLSFGLGWGVGLAWLGLGWVIGLGDWVG